MDQNKELKRMSRRELVEIIYEMKKNEQRLQAQLETAKEALAKRELYVNQAGSIAEAALALNQVFEAAQAAADDYLRNVKMMHPVEKAPE